MVPSTDCLVESKVVSKVKSMFHKAKGFVIMPAGMQQDVVFVRLGNTHDLLFS